MTAVGLDPGARYLFIPLGGAVRAIPVDPIVEILQPRPLEPVPGAQAVVAGIGGLGSTPIPHPGFPRAPRRRSAHARAGLALATRIVERHHGRVRAEGTPGAGAAFHFALPNEGHPS